MNAATDPTLKATDDSILARIATFVADAADVPLAQVTPTCDIYADLGVDSLGTMAIFVDISYEFDAPEPPEDFDFKSCTTPLALMAYVRAHGKKGI